MYKLALALPFAAFSCADETISGYADRSAVYQLSDIGGVPYKARATITFPEEGRATGEGPCNAWNAMQSAPYPWIDLGPIAATKRACPELGQEAVFFEALAKATLAEIQGNILILTDEDGREMTFVSVP